MLIIDLIAEVCDATGDPMKTKSPEHNTDFKEQSFRPM